LDELERLSNPKDFFRINRKLILNIKAIQKISPHFNGRLKLELAPQYREDFLWRGSGLVILRGGWGDKNAPNHYYFLLRNYFPLPNKAPFAVDILKIKIPLGNFFL
jgi:hypothetical protein